MTLNANAFVLHVTPCSLLFTDIGIEPTASNYRSMKFFIRIVGKYVQTFQKIWSYSMESESLFHVYSFSSPPTT